MLCVHTLYFTSFKDVVCTDISTRMCVVSLSPMCIENRHINTPLQSVCINNACVPHVHLLNGTPACSPQIFAAEYVKANRGVFETEDAAYILSFSIMMLHTSLHNPYVKHRTSKEQWLKMNRGGCGQTYLGWRYM